MNLESFLIQNLLFKGNIIFILRNEKVKQFVFIQGYIAQKCSLNISNIESIFFLRLE